MAYHMAVQYTKIGDAERARWYMSMYENQRWLIQDETRMGVRTADRLRENSAILSEKVARVRGSLLNPHDPYAQAGPTGGRSER